MFIVLTMGQDDKSSRFVGPFRNQLEASDYAAELKCLKGTTAKTMRLEQPEGFEPGL